ncbi:hypothetical protein [Streptomyces sp. WP-1]|nr:hypothetical protein [Streptomyces sp. WP-1]WKE71837.1 hypothetical protein QHG49_23915 [Streptomyces sp. WP-1]
MSPPYELWRLAVHEVPVAYGTDRDGRSAVAGGGSRDRRGNVIAYF